MASWLSRRRGTRCLLGAVLMLGAVVILGIAPASATVVLPDADPGSGGVVAAAAGAASGEGPYAADRSAPDASALDAAAVPGLADAVSSASVAAGLALLPPVVGAALPAELSGDAVAADRATTPSGPVLADADLAVLLVGGIIAVVVATLVRRRHRRRIGWGVLPERSMVWRDDFGD